MKKKTFQIAFMPYAPIEEKFSLGQYDIWPFYKEAEKIVSDKEALEQLRKFFGRYFEFKRQKKLKCHGEQLCQVVIISPQDFKIGQNMLSENQMMDIQSIAHIMAFSSIFEIGFSSTTSDPFLVLSQGFVKNEEGMTIWNKAYTNYSLFKVLKPLYVESSFFPYRPTDFSNALAKSLELKESNKNIKRILRSLELIYHTVTFGDMITNEHRLLTLVMAFEVLLDFENKLDFVKSIQRYINDHNSTYVEREIYIERNKKQLQKWPITSWWIYDLYDLRSEIIHGENAQWKLKEYGFIWQRLSFAGNLLKRIYKILLSEVGLWKDDFMSSLVEVYDMDEKLVEIVNEFKEMNPDLYNEK